MITFLLGLLLALGSVTAAKAQAERAYRAGHYAEAAELYRQALTDPDSAQGPLFYNLGNCAYRLGHHATALHYYRRAELRLPGDAQLEFNLGLTERALGSGSHAQKSLLTVTLAYVERFDSAVLLAIAAGLQTLGLFGLLCLRSRRTTRRALVLVLLLGLALGMRLLQVQYFPAPREAIALATEIELRAEPHLDLPITLEIPAGETLRVLDLSDRWARVMHPSGSGWTERAGIGLIR